MNIEKTSFDIECRLSYLRDLSLGVAILLREARDDGPPEAAAAALAAVDVLAEKLEAMLEDVSQMTVEIRRNAA